MSLIRILALVLAFAMPLAAQADTDRGDPRAVSEAFLTAFQARDPATLATLVNQKNRPLFEAIAAEGESHPDYGEVFSGWRAEAADGWDGTTLEIRYAGEDAIVRFADLSADEIAVLVLENQDGWAIEDINSPDRASFEALPTAP